jgi:hypothetical protein
MAPEGPPDHTAGELRIDVGLRAFGRCCGYSARWSADEVIE